MASKNSQAWCQKNEVKNKVWIFSLFLAVLFRAINLFGDLLFWLIHLRKEKVILPAFDDSLLLESATSLAKKIRTQKVSSEEVVKAFIKRIKAVNPIINCVVDNRFELALEEAKSVDKLIQSGEKSQETLEQETPFLGVPFTIKDCFAVKGLRWTSGLVKRKSWVADFDSDVIVLMKKSGAIMLAVTNTPELCMWWESNNNVYGRSRNPYDTNRIVGGSSGGEGGILAAGGSPFGIGSDIGGSIRLPSFFNGLFGHKPTTGVVSNYAHHPPITKVLDTYLVSGPMSRYCVDLIPMFKVLAGSNIDKLKLDSKVSLSKMRFFYMKSLNDSPLVGPVHPDLTIAQMQVVRHIEKAFKVPVKEVKLNKLAHATEMWFLKISNGGNPLLAEELTMREGKISVGAELLKYCVGKSDYTLYALFLSFLEKFDVPPTHPRVKELFDTCDLLKHDLQELLGNDGVLLLPTCSTPAPYHNQTITRPFDITYSAVFNLLGVPSTQVPLGLGSWGVPLGIQVVGNLYNDHLTLAVAAELENAFGGWIPPSPVNC